MGTDDDSFKVRDWMEELKASLGMLKQKNEETKSGLGGQRPNEGTDAKATREPDPKPQARSNEESKREASGQETEPKPDPSLEVAPDPPGARSPRRFGPTRPDPSDAELSQPSGRTRKRTPPVTRQPPISVASNDEHAPFIERQVEQLRERLLDLSNRNRLLNFKHPQKSRKQVRVIDELPAVLFERLISGKAFRFKPVDQPPGPKGHEVPILDAARAQGLNPNFDLGIKPAENIAEQHVDAYIQVLHYPTEMSRRLEGIRQEHLTSLQELGVPSLYAVFGFLEWYERPTSETALLSPLILLPLEIERTRERGLYQYRVSATSEEPEPNRTLAFRLRQDSFSLPDIDELTESGDVDAYFKAVESAISSMPQWRVRRFVTVCAVSFARQVMFEDLAPERWSERGGRASNSLLRGLLGGVDTASLASGSGSTRGEPALVTEADSTQIAAIKDALAGRCMVVKGPPGTGKSQTITNLIASALAEQKRVLFVAEKMAALEVVKKRLDDAGLANFCLALHSTRAKKRDVLDALDRSMKARDTRDWNWKGPEPRRQERIQALEELEAYLDAISNHEGSLGLAGRQIIWQEQAIRSELGVVEAELLRLAIPNASSIKTETLHDAAHRLKELESAARHLRQPPSESPWSFVTTWDPTQHDIEALVASLEQWSDALRAMVSPVAELGWQAATLPIGELIDLGAQLADLTHAESRAPAELVGTLLADERHRVEVTALVKDLESRRAHARRVQSVCSVEKSLPHRSNLSDFVSTLRNAGLLADRMMYSETGPRLAKRRASLEALQTTMKDLRQIADGLGLPVGWDTRSQRTLLTCMKLAAEVGKDFLRRRVPEAFEEESRAIIQKAAEAVVGLKAERAKLDQILSGWDRVGGDELRRHATVLRTTGFFGRLFGSDFKASKATYLSMSTGRGAAREVMAGWFQRAAEHLEAEDRAITGSTRLRQACGKAFDGITTDFEHLICIAQWGDKVREQFPPNAALARWMGDILFKSEFAQIVELVDFYGRAGATLLREIDASPVDLQDLTTAALANVERAEQALSRVSTVEINGRTAVTDLAEVATALEEVAKLDARVNASPAKGRLGTFWQGPSTDTDVLRSASSASETIRDIAFPPYITNWLVTAGFSERIQEAVALGRGIDRAAQTERQAREHARACGVALAEVVDATSTVAHVQVKLVTALRSGRDELSAHLRYITARASCAAIPAVDVFCRAIEDAPKTSNLPMKFEWVILRTLAADLMRKQPKLIQEAWSGVRLAHLRAQVRALESEAQRHRRERVSAEVSGRSVPIGRRSGARREWTDASLITHEVSKSKRNIPIRALMSRAQDAILTLTPCLMMSPLSIAQFLEDPSLQFDLLIVDEASQLRPEESLGALLRARQVVVVGDEQQLPPTSFFKRTDEEALEDDEYEDVEAESLLDLAMNAFGEPRVLRWHYRSRHESLIQFSNQEFYKNELVVAPAPRSPGSGIGVTVEYVKGLYQASTNPLEAARVVQVVFDLMKRYPSQSIGVVAINQTQANLVREQIDEAVSESQLKYIESYKNSMEYFFVKNLENVQGDERDIIVVSMTYGPAEEGGVVAQRFGPIVGANGHRRLNVLFSRAKHQLVVVTSMRPEDVRADHSAHRGPQVLRAYLEYATKRAAALRDGKQARYLRLAQEITDLGFDVVPGVGAQSLELDFAVRHPDDPSNFIAGVEVDAGESESLLKSTDRELVRPVVLQRLGWTVVPVWTSDWLREPAVARIRLRDGLAEACRLAKKAMPPPRAVIVDKSLEETAGAVSTTITAPPPLIVELRAGDSVLRLLEVHGARVRIGRGGVCEVRVPDEYEEVAALHLELRWDRGQFAIVDVDARVGAYTDGVRLIQGPLVKGRSHHIRLGLGAIAIRVAYGIAKLEPMSPSVVRQSASQPSDVQLGADERQFLTAIRENGQMRTSELARLLAKPAVRVNGMVRVLRKRLHDAGMPLGFEESRLPDGEVLYKRLES